MSGGLIRSARFGALAALLSCVFAAEVLADLLAFPGAEGAGALATGGRGGEVYHVTTLADSGAGSLRNGVIGSVNPRTIVFDVGGVINLNSPLEIRAPNLTIAGQTAPGNGIVITGDRVSLASANGFVPNNAVIRYMRFRNGSDPINDADDSFSINAGNNIMIDHVSASWGSDENLSITGLANNVTVQWSVISEGLNANRHGYGSLIAPETTGTRITLHHNLYASNSGRVPRAGSRKYASDFVFDYRNNVAYNWGTQGDWGGWAVVGGTPNEEFIDENFINNYYIAGPNTTTTTTRNTALSSNYATSRIYQSGNLIDSNRDAVRDGTNTGWSMVRGTYTAMTEPFPIDPAKAVTTESALDAYNSVLNFAGANFPVRDTVDTRVIGNVRNQTGALVNRLSDLGGFPTASYPTTARPAGYDTDLDGMPNAWEIMNGLDPNNGADRNLTNLSSLGYTNLEMFLNNLVYMPASGLAGDFNADGSVDAADYVTWVKGLGTTFVPSDYYVWRTYFGQKNGSGLGDGSVPEPAASMLVMLALGTIMAAKGRRCRVRA